MTEQQRMRGELDDLIESASRLGFEDHLSPRERAALSESGYDRSPVLVLSKDSTKACAAWTSRAAAILRRIGADPAIMDLVENVHRAHGKRDIHKADIEQAVGALEAVRHQVDAGLLLNLKLALTAEVLDDFLAQAEGLIALDPSSAPLKTAATVLAGAVLEDALRTTAMKDPEIKLPDRPTLSVLNDALKSRGVYNVPTWRQVQAWADLRNLAAHGKHHEIDAAQIPLMIQGIRGFLASHLG